MHGWQGTHCQSFALPWYICTYGMELFVSRQVKGKNFGHYLIDRVWSMLLDIFHPSSDIVVGGFISDVIYQQYAHCTSIVSCTHDAIEIMLSSRISNLKQYSSVLTKTKFLSIVAFKRVWQLQSEACWFWMGCCLYKNVTLCKDFYLV